MRVSALALAMFAAALTTSGCASQKMERQLHDARMRSVMAEQRSAELDARLRSVETSMLFQQSMLGRAMTKQDAMDRNVASLAGTTPRPAQAVVDAPPKELVDLPGQAVVIGADDATVRDIMSKVEVYMGRPLAAAERQKLADVLRRPRMIDTTNPWGPSDIH